MTLRLDHLRLQNYRCFSSLDLTLDSRMTVIVARNGCGKTAVLDALAVGLGPFVGSFDTARGTAFAPSDVRMIQREGEKEGVIMEPLFPLTLEMAGQVGDRACSWSRELNSSKSHTTFRHARCLLEYGKGLQEQVRQSAASETTPPLLPLVSYYGTGRLWGEKRLVAGKRAKTKAAKSRTAGYTDCLDAMSRYKIFADWFENLSRSEFEERDHPGPLASIRDHLQSLRQAVDTILGPTGWRRITFRSTRSGIVAHHPRHGTLAVDQLSDGIRNMVGLAADMAHRAIRLNPHLGTEAVRQTPGVVLIDEVDMHLHPQWQQGILQSLKAAFPLVQFVVTTHSPQVITTVKKESIRLLGNEGTLETLEADLGTYGARSSRVLAELFGVSVRPEEIPSVKDLQEYLRLVEQGKGESEEARTLRRSLEEDLGSQDPDLLSADARVSQIQFLRERRNP